MPDNKVITEKDLEAVKRLRDYYRQSSENGASDKSFMQWLEDALEIIRSEDMQRVKQIIEGSKQ